MRSLSVLRRRMAVAAGSDAVEVKLFGKWSFEEVEVSSRAAYRVSQPPGHRSVLRLLLLLQVTDISLEDYIAVKPKFAVYVPHTAGRYQKRRFRKALCPIVERCGLRNSYLCCLSTHMYCGAYTAQTVW